MWTDGLAGWYARGGRHHLPWRHTRDPWAILVSEVMLQQTQVSRVLPRWRPFIARWPDPGSLAVTPLIDLLRAWQGLGYPRRARDLHRTASLISATGWPRDERTLCALPGVGEYTARALLVLAFAAPAPLPRDVNIARVTARAALGVEPEETRPSGLDAALASARPPRMSRRCFVFALFDAGALHCRARPLCAGCPLARGCRSRERLASGARQPSRLRQARYAGSARQLRGAVLAALLGPDPPRDLGALELAVADVAAARPVGAVPASVDALLAEGLLQRTPAGVATRIHE